MRSILAGLMLLVSVQVHADVLANPRIPKDPVHQVLLKFLEARTTEEKLAYVRPYQIQRDILFNSKNVRLGFNTLIDTEKIDPKMQASMLKPEEGDGYRVEATIAKAKWGPRGPSATSERTEGAWYVVYEKGEWRVDVEATVGWTIDWKAYAIQRPKNVEVVREVAYLEPNGRYSREFPESKYLEVRIDNQVGALQFYVERGTETYDILWRQLKNGEAKRCLLLVRFPEKETFFKSEVEIVGVQSSWILGSNFYSPKALIDLPARKDGNSKAKPVSSRESEE